jgi:lipoyl(octanoyl) transferase
MNLYDVASSATDGDRIDADRRTTERLAIYCDLGLVPYREAWAWQRQLLEARRQQPDRPDILLMVEHPPVYTLGRGSSLAHLRFDPDRPIPGPSPGEPPIELHRIERGGEVTYHCPGQLVGYPILNLQRHRPDLHWYLRSLEQVLIDLLAIYGLQGDRIPGLTGVWVEGHKVAAIGVSASRWITMHGFALNVCPDLAGFRRIVPCGIADRPVGSLAQFVPSIELAMVRQQLAEIFAATFGLRWQAQPIATCLADCEG